MEGKGKRKSIERIVNEILNFPQWWHNLKGTGNPRTMLASENFFWTYLSTWPDCKFIFCYNNM